MAALLGASASGAWAFDEINWSWDKDIIQTENIDITVTTNVEPDGLVQVEKMQINIGDTKARAIVNGITNNAASEEGGGAGTVSVNQTFTFDPVNYDPVTGNFPCNQNASEGDCTLVNQNGTPTGPLTATIEAGAGHLNESGNEFSFDLVVSGEIPVAALDFLLDAADLPKIENAATAVANNQSITADTAIYLSDAQYNFGGFPDWGEDMSTEEILAAIAGTLAADAAFDEFKDNNLHTAAAFALTLAAAGGVIEPAEVKATARVSDILNAYVDNSATAVANNASFEILDGSGSNNKVVVADLTQFNYGDVTARASVRDVELNGYDGFGDAFLGGGGDDVTPIVTNVATAVGNNMSIKVGVPDPDVAAP
jgi:hypothetical protein